MVSNAPPLLQRPGITTSRLWRYSPADRPPLRIGLLLDSPELVNFSARVIEDIQASNFTAIDLLVYKKSTAAASSNPPAGTLKHILHRFSNANLRKHLLYDLYLRLDQRMKPPNHPLDPVDGSQLLMGIESIEVEPLGKKFVHRFPPDALDRIRAKNLDVLIRFGFNILKGEILTAARYGVWSYHHGDNDFYRGGPSHFWELYERSPLSGVILQVLTEEIDAGLVLCKSLFNTPATNSASVNRFGPYWGASDLVIRKLNELHRFGWEHLRRNALPPSPYRGKRKIYRTPSNLDMARWLAPLFVKKVVRRAFPWNRIHHWRIGIRLNRMPLFDEAFDGTLDNVRWIESPKGHFWADPFVIAHHGKNWVFFEDYSYATTRGHIACAEILPDGSFLSPLPCLQNSARHYSYPYIFREDHDLFMIPETGDSGSIDLYRCTDFPQTWVHDSTLLRGKFVDTSIWKDGGLWWLMTTSADPNLQAAILLLFFSEHLRGPWQFHPANPISTDVRNNRGAGRIFWSGQRWIRPSQNCSPSYGYSFTLNEVTKLSATEYSERPIREIRPELLKGIRTTHTYNWIPGIELIDGTKVMPLSKL